MMPKSKNRFVLSSERTLLRFLKSYERVARHEIPQICSTRINESQVTVWYFKGGVWRYGQPDELGGSRSWCYAHLAAEFKWSDDEYRNAKKELCSNADELNGVYRRSSATGEATRYAIVYRPASKLSVGEIAAIASGVAIAGGLGFVGMRRTIRARRAARVNFLLPILQKQQASINDIMALKQHETLRVEDLSEFESYKKNAQEYASETGSREFLDRANFIELLMKLNVPETQFDDLFNMTNFDDMISTDLFADIDKKWNREPFEAKKDTVCTFKIAREYVKLAYPPFQALTDAQGVARMLNLLDVCPSKTIAAMCQIFEKRLFDQGVYNYVTARHTGHRQGGPLTANESDTIRNHIKLLYMLEPLSPGYSEVFEASLHVLKNTLKNGDELEKYAEKLSALTSMQDEIQTAMIAQRDTTIDIAKLPNFSMYQTGAMQWYEDTGNRQFLDHVNFIKLLNSLQVSENVFRTLLSKSFREIINDPLFVKMVEMSTEPFHTGDNEYCMFQIAKDYARLISPSVSDSEFVSTVEQLRQYLGKCAFYADWAMKQLLGEASKELKKRLQQAEDLYEFKHNKYKLIALNEIDEFLNRFEQTSPSLTDADEKQINHKMEAIATYLQTLRSIPSNGLLFQYTTQTFKNFDRVKEIRTHKKSQTDSPK